MSQGQSLGGSKDIEDFRGFSKVRVLGNNDFEDFRGFSKARQTLRKSKDSRGFSRIFKGQTEPWGIKGFRGFSRIFLRSELWEVSRSVDLLRFRGLRIPQILRFSGNLAFEPELIISGEPELTSGV